MALKLEIINPLVFKGWDELLLSNAKSAFSHSEAWARVLYDTFGYNPLYFCKVDDYRLSVLFSLMEINSKLTGRRGVCLPFTDICEPIVDTLDQFNDAIKCIIQFGEKCGWKTFVLKGGKQYLEGRNPSQYFYTHTLELKKDEKEIFDGFKGNTKRNIKKAIREGVQVEICDSLASFKEFYRLYAITRKRQGTAIEPFRFFKNFHKHITSKGKGIVVLAAYKEKYIAAAVYVHFGKNVIFQYGASDKKYQNLRPNNLIMWEAIRWWRQKGFSSFSFGVTKFENGGLRRYKNGMATDEQTLSYYVYNIQKRGFLSCTTMHSDRKREILEKAPIILLKLLGTLFYKHTNSHYK